MAIRYKWKSTGIGVVDNLGVQLAKIIKGATQGSIETKYRYIEAGERFIKFVAENYKLKKLQNIQDKHLKKYVENLKGRGCADKYIKNELSGIRYIHRQIPQARYQLADSKQFNKECGLASTPDGRADRAWTDREIAEMKIKALEEGQPKIAQAIEAARSTGMRLDEMASLRRNAVENALRTGVLSLTNTKNGRPRDVPLTVRSRECFERSIRDVLRGGYAFCSPDLKVHQFESRVTDFIYKNRHGIQDKDRVRTGHNLGREDRGALTYHGLRHAYAREQMRERLDRGLSLKESRSQVAELLGHGRDNVTKIYTSG